MKKVLFSLLFTLGLFSAPASAAATESLFVNVTSSDNITGPMAVMFANKGLTKGLKMTIFLNTEGVQLAVKKYSSPICAKNGKSVQEMLAMFMKNGGRVLVCPSCMAAQGYEKADLIPGVEVSDVDKTFDAIAKSKKIISF